MKKSLSAILAVLMIAAIFTDCSSQPNTNSSTAANSSDKTVTESDTQQTEAQAEQKVTADDLPKAVDLRDYNGKNYVTAVKRQAFGDCWSFGNIGAAECSYLYENDLGVPAGEVNNNVNFSERYMSWTVFHNITKDDVKLGKVRQSQVGEGYDLGEMEEKNPVLPFIMGAAGNSGSILFA